MPGTVPWSDSPQLQDFRKAEAMLTAAWQKLLNAVRASAPRRESDKARREYLDARAALEKHGNCMSNPLSPGACGRTGSGGGCPRTAIGMTIGTMTTKTIETHTESQERVTGAGSAKMPKRPNGPSSRRCSLARDSTGSSRGALKLLERSSAVCSSWPGLSPCCGRSSGWSRPSGICPETFAAEPPPQRPGGRLGPPLQGGSP